MTKTISKTIRLLVATALFAVLFSLNTSVMPMGDDGHGNAENHSIEMGWIAQVHAQTTPPTPAPSAPSAPPLVTAEGNVAQDAAADKKNIQEVRIVPDPNLMLNTVAKAATYVNLIFNPLIHFITFKIGPFLGNDYIFAGNMGTMLHSIWVINRNICNIVFVLVLLYLALKFIILGDESGIGKNLGTFAIMLVAINFSWLAGKLVLDAANVATNVVFAIPAGISGVAGDTFDKELAKPGNQCKVNDTITVKGKLVEEFSTKGYCSPVAGGNFLVMDATSTNYYIDSDSECGKDKLAETEKKYEKAYAPGGGPYEEGITKTNRICWQQMKLSDYQQNNASYYLSYSMSKVQNLVRSTSNDPMNTAVGTLFSLALQIAYLLGFLSLFIVLIMRAAMMWILMAFSPYIVLLLYLEKAGIGASMGEANEILSPSAFAKWAFAPAKVGAVWSVGFIMITAGQTMDISTFEKIGAHIYGAGTLFMGMDTVQQFIWYLMSLGVIWFGTFAMFADLKFASAVTDKIKHFAEGGVSLAGSTFAKHAPLFPVYDVGAGKMKAGTISDAMKTFHLDKLSTESTDKGTGGLKVDKSTKGEVDAIMNITLEPAKYDEIRQKLEKIGLNSTTSLTNNTELILSSDKFGSSTDDRKKFIHIAETVLKTPKGTAPAPAAPPNEGNTSETSPSGTGH